MALLEAHCSAICWFPFHVLVQVPISPQRTWPLLGSTVTYRLRMPNPGLLAPDSLVLICLYFHSSVSTSQTQCGEKTLVWSQLWLSHQLSEDPGKSLDLASQFPGLLPSHTPHIQSSLFILSHICPPCFILTVFQ